MQAIIMGVILAIGPLAGYFLGGRDNQGILLGLGLAALVLGIYLIIERIPLDMLFLGILGGGLGLVVAKGIEWALLKMDFPAGYEFIKDNSALLYLFVGILGAMVAIQKKSELDLLDKDLIIRGNKNKDVKVLDTSCLIDGRISDVVETGFLDGKFLVPRFILQELQTVADSSDATKRQRGRRGLDILKNLQDGADIQIKVYDKDYPHIKEVDMKLIELARELGAKVATTDYNLNKVAALHGVSVLNVNDLAQAMRSVVLPGDTIMIYLAKDGKEKQQAVGYLDDGTMVVVDDARKFIGKRLEVHVNSILQTSAGRMIFARPQDTRVHQTNEREGEPGQDARAPQA